MIRQLRIKEGLMEIIGPYLPEERSGDTIQVEMDFVQDLKVNSAHMVDIVLDIEDKFDIVINDDAIGTINTIQDSIDLIVNQLAERELETA